MYSSKYCLCVMEHLSIIGMDALVANTQHLQQIIELYKSFYNETFQVSPELFHSTILSLPKAQWMLAVVDTFCGRVIGLINAHVEHSYLYKGNYICVVTDFIVHPEYRRKGIGTWMLGHVEHYARRHSCRILRFVAWRPAEHAHVFFTDNGYTMVQAYIAERALYI